MAWRPEPGAGPGAGVMVPELSSSCRISNMYLMIMLGYDISAMLGTGYSDGVGLRWGRVLRTGLCSASTHRRPGRLGAASWAERREARLCQPGDALVAAGTRAGRSSRCLHRRWGLRSG